MTIQNDCSSPTGARSPAGSSAPAATSASRPSRSTPTPTPACRSSREADVAVRLPGNAPAETYLRGDLVIEAAPRRRRRRGPPRLRLPVRERRLRPRGDRRRADLGRPDPGVDRAMGSKVEAKKLMARGRRPGARRARRRTPSPRPTCRCWSRRRPAAAAAACASCATSPTSPARSSWPRAEAASAFGDATVFVEPYVEQRPARRGAGPRRHARHRARRSASATARSSAGTRRSSRRRRRRASPDGRRARRCTTPRAPPPRRSATSAPAPSSSSRRRDRAVLLPRDEHPAPGRAPGHRGGHRRRPGRAADRASPRAGADGASTARRRGRAAARGRGAALRRGPGRTAGSRRAAG